MAAPAGPGAVLGGALAPAPAPATTTLLTIAPGDPDYQLTGGLAGGDRAMSIPATSPVVEALEGFMPFSDTSSGEKALSDWQWAQVLLPGAQLEDDAASRITLRSFSILERRLTPAAATLALGALGRGRLFESAIDARSFEQRIVDAVALLADHDALDGPTLSPSSFEMGLQWLTPGTPAVPGRAAVYRGRGRARTLVTPAIAPVPPIAATAGPADLEFLSLTSVVSLQNDEAELPLVRGAVLLRFLGNVHDVAERNDAASDVRIAAGELINGLELTSRHKPVSATLPARLLPALLDLMLELPNAFHLLSMDRAAILGELSDRITFATGNEETKARVERSRLLFTFGEYPHAGGLLKQSPRRRS